MTIHTRPDEKVFASGAKPGEMVDFPDIERGWGLAFEQTEGKPPMEWMNGAFLRLNEAVRYFMQRGLPEWSRTEDYPAGARVQHGEGTYRSLLANKEVEPGTAALTWTPWGINHSELAALAFSGKFGDLSEVPIASTTVKGLIEIATATEAKALADALRAVTPATLGAVLLERGTGPAVAGNFSNLKMSATGTNATIDASADGLIVGNGNDFKALSAANISINSASSGANGLDTGGLATSTWYSVWVIWNGTTVSGLLSLSETVPALPGGYTHKARVGWIRTDASANRYPLAFTQAGRRVQYKIGAGSNVSALPPACVGVQGTWSQLTPVWAAVSITSLVPPTAGRISLQAVSAHNNGDATNVCVAPNSAYKGTRTNAPPPLSTTLGGGTNGTVDMASGEMVIEGTNIYVVSQTAAGAVMINGWEDNL